MLHLYFSNCLPVLTDRLLRELAQSGAGVFDMDEVLVPSVAVRRALQLSIAQKQGICANLSFNNLGRWLWQMVGRVVPGIEAESPFQPANLTWQVLAVLGQPAFVVAHPRLAQYLGAADEVMRYELAARIAALYDQYITYRSDWLEGWAAGNTALPVLTGTAAADVVWQSALWQALLARLNAQDRHPRQQFIAALQDPEKAALLPRAVHLLALPSSPPLHVEWLHALAPHLQIHLYVLNPCQEYWAEIVAPRRLAQLRALGQDAGHEVGNPLLAAWAGPTRAYFKSLVDAFGDDQQDDLTGYAEPVGESVLARLQRSILHLEDLPAGSLVVAPTDRSLEVHVCHSLTRQLEVVVDRLLGLFADDAEQKGTLHPSDILIVVPDLETAAPMVDAVFSALPESRRIPYLITGRARVQADTAARTLCALLSLAGSRLEADATWNLLTQPLVARRFGLNAERLETLRVWLEASGYRWGVDAAHRARVQLPDGRRHTLTEGLDRLFLSYALPAGQLDPLLDDLLPAAGVVDPAAIDLAALDAYVQLLAEFVTTVSVPRTASAWSDLLNQALDDILSPDQAGDEVEEFSQTRHSVQALCAAMQRADAAATFSLAVVQTALASALEDPAHGGVPSGGVTVASVSSLRGLSFRVVCILGLDDGAYPRAERAVDFDLMAREPRAQDRQRRLDDRNVFLDHLVAVGDVLHLSYTGFNDRTNAVLPPSMVVSELLDVLLPAAIAEGLSGADRLLALQAARARLVITHPLQAFSSAHFDPADPRRHSYNAELASAQRSRLEQPSLERFASSADHDEDEGGEYSDEGGEAATESDVVEDPRRPFFTGNLPATAPVLELAVDDLARFFRGPAAYLVERQLNLTLARAVEELAVQEPLLPDWDRDRGLEARLFAAACAGVDAERLRRYVMASPEVPSGVLGRVATRQLVHSAVEYAAQVAQYSIGVVLPLHEMQLDFVIDGAPLRLTGAWSDLRSSGLLRVSPARPSASTLLGTWVEHVALCCALPVGMPGVTRQLFRGELATLQHVHAARDVMGTLLSLYRQGLQQPLHFYPKSSLAFAENGGNRKAAQKVWEDSQFSLVTGESAQAAVKLALRGVDDPLGTAFESLSMQVLAPLLAVLQRDVP